ncbi:MAG: hypothetical protein ABIG63_21745 [Chloroflexota bacterium]
MTIRYNDQGKFFTDRITKEAVPAIIQTLAHRIEGDLYARLDERLIDALNKDEQFVAVTDAMVFNARGQQLYQSDFLVINRDHIVWVISKEESDGSSRKYGVGEGEARKTPPRVSSTPPIPKE